MKTKIAFIIATLALIISMSFFVYALLTVTEETPDLNYQVGEFKIGVTGEFHQGLIVPGVNIVKTPFIITNNSTIDIEIRVKLTIKLHDEDFSSFEDINGNPGFDLSLSNLNEVDGFYYINNPQSEITLFTKMILDGKEVQSAKSGQNFKVSLIIHAKQEKHAGWVELGNKLIN